MDMSHSRYISDMDDIPANMQYSTPNRRVSWDDFSLFYQTTNDYFLMDYPIAKSENPSPKEELVVVEPRDILTLSPGNHSETDDMDTTSASTASSASGKNHHCADNLVQRQSSKHSLDGDLMETDQEFEDEDSSISLPHRDINKHQDEKKYNDDAKTDEDVDAISLCLDIEQYEGVQTGNNGDDDPDDSNTHQRYHSVPSMLSMELKLHEMTEKMGNLLNTIKELERKNKYLETTKKTLAINTANAMNEYRETIKALSKKNKILLAHIKRK